MITIETGEIIDSSGERVSCSMTHGWDPKASLACDTQWKKASLELLQYVMAQDYDDAELIEVVSSISMEDDHWQWFEKAMAFRSDEYEWFHLYAEGQPQAACVIFHPKKSALSPGDIFYVEFVAVAPWNRKCKVRDRRFRGTGTALLRAALRFAVQTLKLRPGFGLHSLPGAQGFYLSLNMVNVAKHDKDTLLYFELPETLATALMGAGS
jgi:hypothetical protein